MKPSDCTFVSLEKIEILCKIGVVLRKKNLGRSNMMAFPTSLVTLRVFKQRRIYSKPLDLLYGLIVLQSVL